MKPAYSNPEKRQAKEKGLVCRMSVVGWEGSNFCIKQDNYKKGTYNAYQQGFLLG